MKRLVVGEPSPYDIKAGELVSFSFIPTFKSTKSIKMCPFCGCKPQVNHSIHWEGWENDNEDADDPEASYTCCGVGKDYDCPGLDEWNERPIEAALEVRVEELESALRSMVLQFSYTGNGKRYTGGLSALEEAFGALRMEDPSPLGEDEMCEWPGCKEEATCGTPTECGYKRCCGVHYQDYTREKV